MRRREFIVLLGGAWPLSARAQQAERMRRIGVLMAYAASDSEAQDYLAAFRETLQKLGWTEGRNIEIETRWAALEPKAMQQFAKELVSLQPDLILSQTAPTTVALLQQTRTIPVIFGIASDPVGSGFVASLARPGGNATGFTNLESSLGSKWLELLKDIAPYQSGRILPVTRYASTISSLPAVPDHGGQRQRSQIHQSSPTFGSGRRSQPDVVSIW
jgi:putative tryptophan/tyrosine transport system substrate-binding protein